MYLWKASWHVLSPAVSYGPQSLDVRITDELTDKKVRTYMDRIVKNQRARFFITRQLRKIPILLSRVRSKVDNKKSVHGSHGGVSCLLKRLNEMCRFCSSVYIREVSDSNEVVGDCGRGKICCHWTRWDKGREEDDEQSLKACRCKVKMR